MRRFNPKTTTNAVIVMMGGLFSMLLLGLAMSWLQHAHGPGAIERGESTPRPLKVVVSGDTNGWLVPCGCTSNQSGGLLRRGTYVREQQQQHDVVLLDAGGAAGGVSPYDRAKFEAILDGELLMGIAAHNLGGPELALGASYIQTVSEQKKLPFVSANVTGANGRSFVDQYRIVRAAGLRLAVIGVVSPHYATDDCLVVDPKAAVLSVLPTIAGQFDVLVLLAYLPDDELRSLARSVPEADIVVGGPTGQSIAPFPIGPVLLASATNKGKFIVSLNSDDQGKPARWRGNVVEVTSELSDDPAQLENLKRFRLGLEERDFAASESGLRLSEARHLRDDERVAGTAACRDCHSRESAAWDSSAHAHAWRTLVEVNAQFDPYCQQCHTTAFGLPSGFTSARQTPERTNVGCESCHGPAQAHANDPQRSTPQIARNSCVDCHDRENSPQFEFSKYWPMIAHGTQVIAQGTQGK